MAPFSQRVVHGARCKLVYPWWRNNRSESTLDEVDPTVLTIAAAPQGDSSVAIAMPTETTEAVAVEMPAPLARQAVVEVVVRLRSSP